MTEEWLQMIDKCREMDRLIGEGKAAGPLLSFWDVCFMQLAWERLTGGRPLSQRGQDTLTGILAKVTKEGEVKCQKNGCR